MVRDGRRKGTPCGDVLGLVDEQLSLHTWIPAISQLQGSTQGPQYYSLTSITSQVPASPPESWLPLGLM